MPYFLLIELAFAAYACIYIYRLSFLVNGVRYFTLVDDQMISMRYAENFANGRGLVWNAGGPRVEGFTNLAWMLYMALFHRLHIARPVISLFVQVSGAALLMLNLLYVKKIAVRLAGHAAAFVALVLTAFYMPLDNWSLQGSEVSLLTLVATAATWWTLDAPAHRLPVGLYLVLGAATLIRPDAMVLAAALLTALALRQPERRWRHIVIGGAIVAVFVAAQTMFRVWYFGQMMPNTYYLKVTGFPLLPRMIRGFMVAGRFGLELVPLAVPLLMAWRRVIRKGDALLLLGVFGSQVAYSIFVGGDAWEWWGGSNRFISIVMPLLFIASAAALLDYAPRITFGPALAIVSAALAIALNLLAFWSYRPVQRLLLIERPLQNVNDLSHVASALALRDETRPDATVAVTWAGAIPYFSERPAIDLLGKTDVRISHEPMHRLEGPGEWRRFFPGHLKWDYQYSIRESKPDVIQAPLWSVSYNFDTPDAYVEPDYDLRELGAAGQWYVRRNSPNVLTLATP